MIELYKTYTPLVNYFFPSMKLQKKEELDAKSIKKYDDAKTAYTRLMQCTSHLEKYK